jgi:bifunctional enzyme CysN/CysC
VDLNALLLAADEGVQEQSRRHGYLLSVLGIKQVVVAVNKMDLVDYKQEVFDQVVLDYTAFLKEIGMEAHAFVPISARNGFNPFAVASPAKKFPVALFRSAK